MTAAATTVHVEEVEVAAEDADADADDYSVEELDPGLDPESSLKLPVPDDEPVDDQPLLSLEEAVAQVPEALRVQMEDLLRAEFREVQRWIPPKS